MRGGGGYSRSRRDTAIAYLCARRAKESCHCCQPNLARSIDAKPTLLPTLATCVWPGVERERGVWGGVQVTLIRIGSLCQFVTPWRRLASPRLASPWCPLLSGWFHFTFFYFYFFFFQLFVLLIFISLHSLLITRNFLVVFASRISLTKPFK